MTSSRHILSDVILTHPTSYSVNQGQVIDHLLILSNTAANLEGMYTFRKNSHRLPIATKQSFEIFIELKEIKQRNEVVEKHKCPLKQWKTVEKLARNSQKSSINRSVIQYILECGSNLFSMQ